MTSTYADLFTGISGATIGTRLLSNPFEKKMKSIIRAWKDLMGADKYNMKLSHYSFFFDLTKNWLYDNNQFDNYARNKSCIVHHGTPHRYHPRKGWVPATCAYGADDEHQYSNPIFPKW